MSKNPKNEETDFIVVTIGQPNPKTSNYVSTSKYSILSFLPVFLLAQFKNVVNIFFLVIGCVTLIPGVNSLGTANGTLMRLGFLISIIGIKEIYEDVKRYFGDRKVNCRLVRTYTKGIWRDVYWSDLKVGHIIRVSNDTFIPADLILLSSSEPAGMAYIETANLDGESSLKIRHGLAVTSSYISEDKLEALATSGSVIRCEPPNSNLYEFSGIFDVSKTFLSDESGAVKSNDVFCSFALSNGHFLPRGSKLKHTDWIYGVVVYAGKKTKLMLNETKPPTKPCFVNKMITYIMTMQFGLLLLICATVAIFSVQFIHENRAGAWYLAYPTNGSLEESRKDYILFFLSFVAMLSLIMPITLYGTLNVIRVWQGRLIEQDVLMYDEATDTRARVRRSNLNETLGQVKYLFCDKTGTLTENKMVFKMCIINGRRYGIANNEVFDSSELSSELLNEKRKSRSTIDDFLTISAVCHTVVPEKPSCNSETTETPKSDFSTKSSNRNELVYHAVSPDEIALVKMARQMGYVFMARTPESVIIEVGGTQMKYDVLAEFEFTSDRKRMAVVVRMPNKRLRIFVKGADSVIMPRISASCDREMVALTLKHLEQFASLGYRTLCLACRDITEKELNGWKPAYDAACTALDNRQAKLDLQAEMIEKDLFLVGVTAIEDKLQLGVPETIARLRESNIKIWILTGDKLETAINVGHSSNLIKPDMATFILKANPDESVNDMVLRVASEAESAANGAALIIDGKTLQNIADEGVTYEFVYLVIKAACVICCRCTPRQKSAMVRLVRTHIDGATAAIGDGANDVAMIHAADVGIGISGREGLQASLAADFSIAQFRFLRRLLLVHGVLCHVRTQKTVFYSIYKNVILATVMITYLHASGWSDTVGLHPLYVTEYNILYTFFPPLSLGIFDQCAPIETLEKDPKLYAMSQNRRNFSMLEHFKNVITAIFHGLVFIGIVVGAMHHEQLWSDGHIAGIYLYGTVAAFALFLFALLQAVVWTNNIASPTIFTFAMSIFVYFCMLHMESFIDRTDAIWVMFTTPSISFIITIAVSVPLLIVIVTKVFKNTYKQWLSTQEKAAWDDSRVPKEAESMADSKPSQTSRQKPANSDVKMQSTPSNVDPSDSPKTTIVFGSTADVKQSKDRAPDSQI